MAERRADEVIFVYNADGGALPRAMDAVHKIVRPETYQCDLCMITHGTLTMRGDWKAFTEDLPVPSRALHRDEFARAFPQHTFAWPAVLLRNGDDLELLVARDELADLEAVKALAEAILQRLAERQRRRPYPQDIRSIT